MIPVTYFRSSSIKEYESCPLRYFANFNLGLKYPSGPSAMAGTIFHKIMEILAQLKISQQEKEQRNHEWGLYCDEETKMSFSFVDIATIDIDKLTESIYEFYIKDIDPARVPKTYQRKTPEASVKAWIPLKKIKQSVENVMAMQPRSFDVRNMNVFAIERKFDIEIKEDWAKYDFTFRNKHYQGHLRIKGSIDLVIEREDGSLEIIDWKSGNSLNLDTNEEKTYDDYYNDIQLQLYYWAIRKLYPEREISAVTIVFLNESKCFSITYDDENIITNRIRSIYEEMQQATRPAKIDSEFCMRFCPYCKNDFSTVITKPLVKPREYIWTNEAGLNEYRQYKMCGQLNLYLENYSPLEVMESIARYGFNIGEYVNT